MKTTLVILVVLSSALSGAQNPTTSAPKFSARAELVTVPVIPSRDGKFLSGLTQADFIILEEGKQKPIAFFEEVTADSQRLQRVARTPGEFTNALTQQQRPTAVTVILIDRLFTPVLEQNNARAELLKFLSHAVERREPTMVTVVGSSGLKIVHDFTTSREVLLAALNKVRGSMTLGPTAEELAREADLSGSNSIANPIDVTREAQSLSDFMTGGPTGGLARALKRKRDEDIGKTLLAMEQLALGLRGIPGRKTLLWVSPGFECPFFGDAVKRLNDEIVTPGQECVNAWRELSAANIAVYQINPVQTVNPVYTGPGFASPQPETSTVQRELMNQSLTTYTGGTVCSYRNDLDTCYKRAVDDSSRYYMLSYYAVPTPKPVWRKIQVKMNVPKATVRARSGYMTAGTEETWEQRRKNDVAIAVTSPIDYTGIPMTVRWTGTQQSAAKRKCSFEIKVSANALTVDDSDQNHLKLNVVAVALSPEMQVTGDVAQDIEARLKPESLEQMKKSGFVYKGALEVPAGDFTVKFIVRDDLSGKLGSVTAQMP